ncbi:PIR Superfamily Protein [Plasmodium ovale curtisi]|uniref:PIR Superfamily Protein n=1 Tax=Plasmodium ovale curtisi TaxID=864141 RepID=A0A1A8WEZ5_PLAOA|nr:PIR Superfamily Protein [Plasmodium ovale curtisi]
MSRKSTYTLDKFADQDGEFKNRSLYIMYNKFMNSCTPDEEEIFKYEHCSLEQYDGILNSSLLIFINKVLTNLKRISNNKLIFSGGIDFDENKVCTNFKYWFLDQILDKEFNDNHIEKLFEKIDEQKKNFVKAYCEFYTMKFGILYSDYYDSTCTRSPYNNKSLCKEFNNYIKNHIKFEINKLSSIKCVADQSPLIEDKQLEYKFSEDKQLPESEDTEVGSQTTEDPGLTGSSMATILPVSFVGIFFVFFLLYKFTPFRSLLHPQIQRMKRLWKNEEQKTKELLINNYETEDSDSENKGYNITYHSN